MQSWNQVHTRNIQHRINACATKLDEWGRVHRNQFCSRLFDCRARITSFGHCKDAASVNQLHTERFELGGGLLARQEAYWRQRAKQFWLASGDLNTRYFHKTVSVRKKRMTSPS